MWKFASIMFRILCLISYLRAKIKNTQKYKFACCFMWVWNLVSHPKGRTYIKEGCLKTECWGNLFGAKRKEITGGWRKLHKEELNYLTFYQLLLLLLLLKTVHREVSRWECIYVIDLNHNLKQGFSFFTEKFITKCIGKSIRDI